MKYFGKCHCGGVAFEVEGELGAVYDCNCSMCQKRGGLFWFVPRPQFRLLTPREALATYRFHKRVIDHHFCPHCGIAPFSEGSDRAGAPIAAINVRCLDGVEPATLEIKRIDGRSL